MHQLAKDKDGKKFLLVFIDGVSHFVLLEPIDYKSAKQTIIALDKWHQNKNPKKWVDIGKEFTVECGICRATPGEKSYGVQYEWLAEVVFC